jgi:Skp family chaperone for outer membrane proteins
MKLALAILVLLSSPFARAEERTGYVDQRRAMNECADGKKTIAELNAADEARAKAKATALAAKKPLAPSDEQWEAQQKEKAGAAAEAIRTRLPVIYRAVLKARKLTTVRDSGSVLVFDPSLDLTAEVIRRLDAGEGKTEADRTAKLEEENARLRQQLAAKGSETKAPTQPGAK